MLTALLLATLLKKKRFIIVKLYDCELYRTSQIVFNSTKEYSRSPTHIQHGTGVLTTAHKMLTLISSSMSHAEIRDAVSVVTFMTPMVMSSNVLAS